MIDYDHLREHWRELSDFASESGYSDQYLSILRRDVSWILERGPGSGWQSYREAYLERVAGLSAEGGPNHHMMVFTAIQQFELHGELPNGRAKARLIGRSAYSKLCPAFRGLIEAFRRNAVEKGHKQSSIDSGVSNASCFPLAMQERGVTRLEDVGEDDVMSFFADGDGRRVRSDSYACNVSRVLRIADTPGSRMALSLMPPGRRRRSNLQFMTEEEACAIRAALDDAGSPLSLRDRAIGRILISTGMRASDIAALESASIDWARETIETVQSKTGQPLVLPLVPAVGNAIWDYIEGGRPASDDPHLFLGEDRFHLPLTGKSIYRIAGNVYRAAGIRQREGDRRGSHLFRHYVATSMLGHGVPRPVISRTLGHEHPASLDPYLHADIGHIRDMALSIDRFPVAEGVFGS
ncbi:MAG: tyrosine-type recombinase/integrase [Eggerthellaceae bacterium]|nr:tyrosine-type recombinase/integrase [Eggerthellaceae bacterium]